MASINDARRSADWALESRANWEAVAVLLNEALKAEIGPAAYAARFGTSALTTLYDHVSGRNGRHLTTCTPGGACAPECPENHE